MSDRGKVPAPSPAPDLAPSCEKSYFTPRTRAKILENRIRSLESDVAFRRRHLVSILREFMGLLGTSEIVAFDLLLARSFFGRKWRDSAGMIMHFANTCQSFRVPAGSCKKMKHSFSRALRHVQFVHNNILVTAGELQTADWARVDANKEEVVMMKEELDRLYMARSDQWDPNELKAKQLKVKVGEETKTSVKEVSKEFCEKLTKLVQPEVRESNAELAEARAALAKVAMRVNTARDLKRQIEETEATTPSLRYVAPRDYGNDSVRQNVLFRRLAGDSAFLRCADFACCEQRRVLGSCREAFCGAKGTMEALRKLADETRQRWSGNIEQLKADVEKKEKVVQDIRTEMDPVYEIFVPDKRSQQITADIEKIEEIDKQIEEALTANGSSDANEALQIFHELREARSQILKNVGNAVEARRANATAQRQLFGVVSDALAQEEKRRLIKREIDVQKSYKEAVMEVRALIDKSRVDDWCTHMGMALRDMEVGMREMSQVVNEIQKIQETDYDSEIKAFEEELESLDTEATELAFKRAALASDVMKAKEALCEQMQKNSMYQKWMGSQSGMIRERQLERMAQSITCSVCNTRYCEVCHTDCGHVTCSKCASKTDGECPICGEKCRKPPLKFYYKP